MSTSTDQVEPCGKTDWNTEKMVCKKHDSNLKSNMGGKVISCPVGMKSFYHGEQMAGVRRRIKSRAESIVRVLDQINLKDIPESKQSKINNQIKDTFEMITDACEDAGYGQATNSNGVIMGELLTT